VVPQPPAPSELGTMIAGSAAAMQMQIRQFYRTSAGRTDD